jgi:uncharacterized protein (DUF2236 family)/Ca2+-binding EF-hand superfamily protein
MPENRRAAPAEDEAEHGPFPAYGSIMWRHVGEWRFAATLGRTLVLQLAHPAVGAGVTAQSTYLKHPWRRAQHTLDSLARLVYAEPQERAREIARIARQHRHIKGVDETGRAYSADDQAVRAWVMATIYEAVLHLRAAAGDPMGPDECAALLREWSAVSRALGVPQQHLPASVDEFERYFDCTVAEVLEDNAAVRHLLGDFLRRAAPPRPLRRMPWIWWLMRPLAADYAVAVIVADLPEVYRSRLGLAATRRAKLCAWLAHRLIGLVGRLHGRLRYQPIAWQAIRRAEVQAHPAYPTPPTPRLGLLGRDLRAHKLNRLFTHVLDQTGDGYLEKADLEAMARAVCWGLEIDDDTELRVHEGFAAWWQQLSPAADAHGRISRKNFVRAALESQAERTGVLGDGLNRAVTAMFEAADTNRDGYLEQDQYQRLLGGKTHPAELAHGFRQIDRDGDGRIGAEEFRIAFHEFLTARGHSAAGSHLLGQP